MWPQLVVRSVGAILKIDAVLVVGPPLGLWLAKSGLLHEGVTQTLVVTVANRC